MRLSVSAATERGESGERESERRSSRGARARAEEEFLTTTFAKFRVLKENDLFVFEEEISSVARERSARARSERETTS